MVFHKTVLFVSKKIKITIYQFLKLVANRTGIFGRPPFLAGLFTAPAMQPRVNTFEGCFGLCYIRVNVGGFT